MYFKFFEFNPSQIIIAASLGVIRPGIRNEFLSVSLVLTKPGLISLISISLFKSILGSLRGLSGQLLLTHTVGR